MLRLIARKLSHQHSLCRLWLETRRYLWIPLISFKFVGPLTGFSLAVFCFFLTKTNSQHNYDVMKGFLSILCCSHTAAFILWFTESHSDQIVLALVWQILQTSFFKMDAVHMWKACTKILINQWDHLYFYHSHTHTRTHTAGLWGLPLQAQQLTMTTLLRLMGFDLLNGV